MTDADTEAGRGGGLTGVIQRLEAWAKEYERVADNDRAAGHVDLAKVPARKAQDFRRAARRLRQSDPGVQTPHLKSGKVREMVCTAFDDGATFGSDPRVTKDDVREESERYATDYVEKVYGRLLERPVAPTDEAPEGDPYDGEGCTCGETYHWEHSGETAEVSCPVHPAAPTDIAHLLEIAEAARDVLADFDYVNEWGYEEGGKSLGDNLDRLRDALEAENE